MYNKIFFLVNLFWAWSKCHQTCTFYQTFPFMLFLTFPPEYNISKPAILSAGLGMAWNCWKYCYIICTIKNITSTSTADNNAKNTAKNDATNTANFLKTSKVVFIQNKFSASVKVFEQKDSFYDCLSHWFLFFYNFCLCLWMV